MVPKESGFNQSETASGKCARVVWRFPCSSATARDGDVIQRQHFCHHGGTICHPKSCYVTTERYGTSTCDLFRHTNFHVSYSRRMPATLNWPRQSICGGCQSSEMAAPLNSLSFALQNRFCRSTVSNNYDYIVKWCSGISCNWCVSLDIS